MGNDNSTPGSFGDRWQAAGRLTDATMNLPPTYSIGDTGRFPQVFPDPISPGNVRARYDEHTAAQANMDRANAAHRANQGK